MTAVLSHAQFRETYENRYAHARVTPGTGYVYNVSTHPEHRGEGHGRAVMGQITEDADRLGRELTVHAREDLHPWYGTMGFQPAGEDVIGPLLKRQPRVR